MPVERANRNTERQDNLSSPNLKEGAPEAKRSPGRPSTGDSKKSNPNYKLTTVFLPKRIYADAQAKLLRSNAETDQRITVSDILSEYLTQWVKE
jgi:hypothetical protein